MSIETQPPRFKLLKAIGRGFYSVVYEVMSTRGPDEGRIYALKRYFLRNRGTIKFALTEHRILKQIATEGSQFYFLPTLFYSFFIDGAPAYVITKGSGLRLSDLINKHFPLPLKNAIFYCAEIICGVEEIHSLGVIHLDIKPANILLTNSGHLMIIDFDLSYDAAGKPGPPKPDDFGGTYFYMAPEIARKCSISVKADTWSIGAVMARMIAGHIQPEATQSEAEKGEWFIEGFSGFTQPLKSFFKACLAFDPDQRPTIGEIKRMKIFKGVDWDPKVLSTRPPPYQFPETPNIIGRTEDARSTSAKEKILKDTWMGKMNENRRHIYETFDGLSANLEFRRFGADTCTTVHAIPEEGLSSAEIRRLFRNIDFINERALQNNKDYE